MGRIARAVVPGIPHHITQRGNHHETVFFHDEDRQVYLKALAQYCDRYGVRLLGYCLMSNHVHFVAVPEREDSLAKAFGRTHNDYARWVHVRHRQTGHLWQNRFFSCPLDSGHCWAALRYVERNPVRAQIVRDATDWRWSSAHAHVTGIDHSGLLKFEEWASCWTPQSWRDALVHGIEETLLVERLRTATRTGRPLGAEGFAIALEQVLHRRLAPRKSGPEPRSRAAGAATQS